ncbi:MAG: tRNA (adenosine(37)-N6)-threonylcarbamoyltransferase complex dimerization subunit type 1 TsaB [Chitinispirillaceae bacterium]
MSFVLGIDTSSTDLGVGLYHNKTAQASVCRFVRNSHAEHITQAVRMVFQLSGISADQITHVAVSVGPGSFTGLRIGLGYVKGLCLFGDQKVLPLSSLHVLAHSVGAQAGKRVFTALDARQDLIHWASFESEGATMIRLGEDRLTSADELLASISSDDLLVTDTMGYTRSTVFSQFEGKVEIRPAEKVPLQRGLSCCAIASCRLEDDTLWHNAGDILPNYLRLSAAQEKACR